MKKIISISLLLMFCLATQAQKSTSVKALYDKIPGLPSSCKEATLLCTYQETGYTQTKLVQDLFKELDILSPWTGESPRAAMKPVAGYEAAASAMTKMEDLMTQFKKEWDEKTNTIGMEARKEVSAKLGDSKPATQAEFETRAKQMTPIQVAVWDKNMPELKALYTKYFGMISPLMGEVDKALTATPAQETSAVLNFRNDLRSRAVTTARYFLDKSSSLSATLANHALRMKNGTN